MEVKKHSINIINFIKESDENSIKNITSYSKKYNIDLYNFSFLFYSLIYSKNTIVFDHLYNVMNPNKDEKFDIDFFSHNFSITYLSDEIPFYHFFNLQDSIIETLVMLRAKEENLYNKIYTKTISSNLFLENINNIYSNIFLSKSFISINKPLELLNDKNLNLIISLLFNANQFNTSVSINHINKNIKSFPLLYKNLTHYYYKKSGNENFNFYNKHVFSHVLNLNENIFKKDLGMFIQKSSNNFSLKALEYITNIDINMIGNSSDIGSKIINVLIRDYEHIYKDKNNDYLDINKELALIFFGEALLYTIKNFKNYNKADIFNEINKQLFNDLFQYAKDMNEDNIITFFNQSLCFIEKENISNYLVNNNNYNKSIKRRF